MEILQMPLQALEERIEREMEQNPVLEVIPRGEQELHEGEPAERKSRDPELGVLRMDPVQGEADFQRLIGLLKLVINDSLNCFLTEQHLRSQLPNNPIFNRQAHRLIIREQV